MLLSATGYRAVGNPLPTFSLHLARYGAIFTSLRSYLRDKDGWDVKTDHIINRIFPARLIDQEQTQVLFLTTSKLLYPWHAIHRTYRISDFLENSLLILDEFDRQQSEFLTHLINAVSDYDCS